MNEEKFKPSKFTIKVKLISIISFVIVSSLLLMIILATQFFKGDSEQRIQENNLQLTDVIGQKIEKEIYGDAYKIYTMALIENGNLSSAEKELFKDLFFKNNKDIIYLSIGRKNGNSISFQKEIYNEKYLRDKNFQKEKIALINQLHEKDYLPSFSGQTNVINISQALLLPAMAISIPFGNDSSSSIVVAYFDGTEFLETFQTEGITKTFLINSRGDLISHPNTEYIIQNKNFIKLPIVQKLLESKINNGQSRYKDENGDAFIGSFKKLTIAGLGIVSTVEEDLAFEAVYNIQRRNFIILVLILNFAIVSIFFYSKSLTTPIQKLVEATKEIENGNYKVHITPSTGDEVGNLTYSFTSMAHGLEERERVKKAFGKFVNKEIAEKATKGEINLGGERRNCAIFFSDIRSFTSISERLTPEKVVEFLNEYMSLMVRCVNETNGVVDKFIGDAIMATWGSITSSPNDAENSINAALMMREKLMEFNKGRGTDEKPSIRIGCGLNWGAVIAGQIGSEERLEYTVIGDAVNLASRVEALNKPMGTDILITEALYSEVKDIFAVEKMQSIKVKGKEKIQIIYAVLGKKNDPTAPKSVEELRNLLGIPFDKNQLNNLESEEKKYEILEK